jgi:signal transduction histidine kinase
VQRFLELGRRPNEPVETVKLAEVARDASALVMPRCQHMNVQLDVHVADALPAICNERGQLLQLLMNLLDNAVEAAGSGGRVRLQIEPCDQGVLLTVSDSGPGPPAAIADQLFEPFVTGRPNGIGLGLAVVRKIVDALQGQVIWDRVDHHTRFRVVLPVSATTESPMRTFREHSIV